MSSAGDDPHYGEIESLVQKAIGEASRASQTARNQRLRDGERIAIVLAHGSFAVVNAVLAVADRLDVLIGRIVDEGWPIAVVHVDGEPHPRDAEEHDDEEPS